MRDGFVSEEIFGRRIVVDGRMRKVCTRVDILVKEGDMAGAFVV